ncbi:Uncharacterised protein [Candidatus Venteria ishoeyi]|uniref:Uncharacterized protein n=2 Tax=Candidatus Venteria ishoeyi TaxID=1899563 RepID=A0A1H6FFT7_9GAMM|nr:Uncharacterised protein [Candidatus Venteria ishoeyi]
MGSFESQYGDSSNVIVTFPTKYRHDSTDNFYREGTKAVGAEFPVASSLGDNNDVKDVCASELTASGGHTTGDGTPAAAGHLTGNPNLYELRNFYPPFRSEGSIQYGIQVWDDQENLDTSVTGLPIFSPGVSKGILTITDEVNYMYMNWPSKPGFGSGWFTLSLAATQGCQYNGAPVLGYTHKTQITSSGFKNSWLVPLVAE